MNSKILVIDDEPILRQVLQYYLEDIDFEVITAGDGLQGIEIAKKERPDVVLTDLRMPGADGLEVLAAVREMDDEIPIIVISGANRLNDAVQALRLGAWDYLIKPIQDLGLLEYSINKVLEKSTLLKENRRYKKHLEELVKERTQELELRNKQLDISRRQIIGILSQAAEYRDFETGNHFLRVSEYAACLARGLGWNEKRINLIKLASPVHDIGKIGILDNILLKEGKLTNPEWHEMQNHCQYGHEILSENRFIDSFMKNDEIDRKVFDENSEVLIETAANIALNHHEKWDGSGYPLGIKGEAIPIEARITAIADVFDALSSTRPYKMAWSEEDCLKYLDEQRGKHFDPELINVFMDNLETIRTINKEHSAEE
ncbi:MULTISPECIES: HD domain-containing phosphohydrolase [unclassified Oceanispirochaeta]|uniref:HD domain-containing phosphohydrolase n=1 Tax=unclassified Oceanispirochaeta TaxID=2635722 RepID=UPI000E09CE43|nr:MULTISPECIES: HD domain-containing phosphohydrolase [unclassified Oceanispirochaeta]MBF9014683.1 response regulator [Oceanispirochaeta sp. M2]NPD70939.1 response regulator [Oceanispirochaeta sp. M1]RDG33773.1 response regulator [Oceanispirochaeta sp. M1]